MHLEFGFVDEFHGGPNAVRRTAHMKRGPTLSPLEESNGEPSRLYATLLRNDVDVGMLLGALDAKLNHAVGFGK
jgi:hypothetical protein